VDLEDVLLAGDAQHEVQGAPRVEGCVLEETVPFGGAAFGGVRFVRVHGEERGQVAADEVGAGFGPADAAGVAADGGDGVVAPVRRQGGVGDEVVDGGG